MRIQKLLNCARTPMACGALLLLIVTCRSPRSNDTDSTAFMADSAYIDTWLADGSWPRLLGSLKPHPSVDKEAFAEQYQLHPDRWDLAFAYLRQDSAYLANVPDGIHELDGRHVFVMVSSYTTKEADQQDYEAHKEYADIQYVVSGEEFIGLKRLKPNEVPALTVPYNPDQDIAFFDVDDGMDMRAGQDEFFVFFPGELHRPSIRISEPQPVKKIVVKIKN